MVGRLAGELVGQLVGGWVGCSVGWWVHCCVQGWLVGWMFDGWVHQLAGWVSVLVGCFVGFGGWWVGGLVFVLAGRLVS